MQRQATHKFALVRDVWDMFMACCEDNYAPHENLTIDDQLLPFRGKCPFRMYIPTKPAKCGIKIFMVNDVKSKYMLKGIPYLEKQGTPGRYGLQFGHMFTKDYTPLPPNKQIHHHQQLVHICAPRTGHG